MRERPITPREEKFTHLLLDGKSQSEAFRVAYPHSVKWKPESVHQNASKLAAKVQPTLAELRKKAGERAVNKLQLNPRMGAHAPDEKRPDLHGRGI